MADRNDPPSADWRLLGLEPGATPEEILRAYEHRRALYNPDALASYSLLLEEERRQHLERLSAARDRLLAEATSSFREPPADPPTPVDPDGATTTGPPPDRERHPGLWLRHHRRQRGITVEQLSRETRIRPSVIEEVETERYGRLPAPVFVRGFVVQIARALAVPDPEDLAALYLQASERGR